MTPKLRAKLTEYHNLNTYKKTLEERLEQLSKEIKEQLDEGTHDLGHMEATIQVKNRTTLDENAFFDHFHKHPLYNLLCKTVPDPVAIEEAYLQGQLTDGDLRVIRKPQYSTALITRSKDVQREG